MSFEAKDSDQVLAGDRLYPNFEPLQGTVVAVQANYYWVRLQETETPISSPLLLCTRRTRLKKMGQRVMVGDRVYVEEPDWAGRRGAISHVLPRQSELDRPPMANADQILLVFALAEPEIEPYQLSRFLVKAESTDLEVCLCLSKSDLVPIDEQARWRDRISTWGYEVTFLSVHQGKGIAELNQRLSHKITVASGPSGVGKSSLINHLIPSVDVRVNAVSGKLAKGRHTTRHVELFELPLSGFLADTPGFNQPDLFIAPQDLASCFPEIRHRLAEATCQFNDCWHRDEPGCAVRGDWERYEHYLSFLDDAIAYQTHLNQQSDRDDVLKLKTKRKGAQYEARLDPKKYRQESRRMQQQSLQKLTDDMKNLMENEDNEG
ncbi:small ribosomal subunit biogenesis GTPase RsgA [Myxacorys almedinensis]|uniref:Small ribosomal subunit biogenesis GTPase RsgA n=1 Tax=Myxacorys almedinensis A TaxID=2690445 RepID=A0A8J7Z0H6_9CYAN|nr:small ribosomal subunit biogenesis GTPase RsgA [Myxacorys almedinensis]NDJ15916.1 small ribosomal subunit biogenesis GTPase RsgA [Myxacorys almedinensis A]